MVKTLDCLMGDVSSNHGNVGVVGFNSGFLKMSLNAEYDDETTVIGLRSSSGGPGIP